MAVCDDADRHARRAAGRRPSRDDGDDRRRAGRPHGRRRRLAQCPSPSAVALGRNDVGPSERSSCPMSSRRPEQAQCESASESLMVPGPGDAPRLVRYGRLRAAARARSFGIAGVAGNGQVELAEALTGVRPGRPGRSALDGYGTRRRVLQRTGSSPASSTSRRTVSETGSCRGGVSPRTSFSVRIGRVPAAVSIPWGVPVSTTAAAIREFRVKTPSASTPCGQLSGRQHPARHPRPGLRTRSEGPCPPQPDSRPGHRVDPVRLRADPAGGRDRRRHHRSSRRTSTRSSPSRTACASSTRVDSSETRRAARPTHINSDG